mgnify:CR=1 FL=1
MLSPLFLVLGVVFILGSSIGSFLNVCIYRVPNGESIVSPPSSCPKCKNRLRWYHNIPVLGYAFLGGRCGFCGLPISLRYPFVEILTGALFLLVFYYFCFCPLSFVYWLFLSLLIVVSFIDLDHQVIPDVISIPGIFLGLICSFLIPWIDWFDSFLGAFLGAAILLSIALLYKYLVGRDGMGMGDVKLLAMLGSFLGWKSIFPIVFLASLIGTVIGVPLMMARRQTGALALPFGPFLAFAATIYLFWGEAIIQWYLGFYD